MSNISVIICTHNPRPDYFHRVLGALEVQTLPRDQWELLVIDNASKEPLAETWCLSWHPRAQHIREDRLGLTHARLRGIKESAGDLLVFVDDDNVLAPNFLQTAGDILTDYPYLGVFGAGILEPEFEVQPRAVLTSRLSMLALRQVEAAQWSNNTKDFDTIPWGAGLCVARRVADHYPQFVDQLNVTAVLDRRGQHLFCGGDDLFSWVSVAEGQGFGLFPELCVTHLISARRLNQSYFLRLVYDHSFSHCILFYILEGNKPEHIGLSKYLHMILHGVRNGLFSARCNWAGARGIEHARRFISEQQLKSIKGA